MMYENTFEMLEDEYLLKLSELSRVCLRLENAYIYFAEQDKQKAEKMFSDLKNFNTAVKSVIENLDARIEKIEKESE